MLKYSLFVLRGILLFFEMSYTASQTVSPVFERTPYGTGINYNQSPGVVFSASATDQDLTGTMVYEVIGYYCAPGYFSINSNGQVVLLSSVANDVALSYTLGLAAYDSNYPNDKAYANLTITVNRNPNAPGFTTPSYSMTVNESYPLAVSLLQIGGEDSDQHDIEYLLESSNPADGTQFFYLNPSAGVLTVSKPLTGTATQTFTLSVRLRDDGIPVKTSATTATVTISIIRNNNGPTFAGTFTTSIREDTPVNQGVLTVTATDADPISSPYGQLTYRLIGDGDFQQFFSIDPTTGNITVRHPLTSGDVASYQGRVVAEDGGSPPRSATATATINILRNLNVPVFNPNNYSVTIFETDQVGRNVLTVTATDADQIRPNNEVVFEMTDTTPNLNDAGSNFFSISSENNRGLISITLPLYTDNLNTPVYSFSVLARDNGSPTQFSVDRATVTINVIRNLFPPVFQGEPYNATLTFNSASGTSVLQVTATDADSQSPHNTVTYSILGDATAQTLFSINPSSGLITTRQSLLNNNVEISSILIMARDGGTPSLTATSSVLVTINRNLHSPRWGSTLLTLNITEEQDLAVTIATLITADDDVEAPYNTKITTLTGDANMLQFFRLTEDGRLSVQRPLTRTTIRTFTGTVSLEDGGNPPRTPTGVKTATITVYVTKNDNTPYFISDPYSKDLEGNAPQGSSVLQVTARDNDQGLFGLVQYRITGDDLAPNYFEININTGLITVKNVLSGVNQDQFKVRVEAYDQGSPSKSNVTVVTLTVKSNYQRPVFNQASYFKRILETQSLGQQIIAVTANDSDALAPNNVVRYSITAEADDIECFLIDAVTGSLSLRRSLLYAPCTASRYQMTVTATDQGLNPLSNTVTVTVDVDRNANPPIFQNLPNNPVIAENQPTGQVFYTITATDADTVSPFNDITYSLLGDGTATIYFQVDGSTGAVSLKQSVQADKASTYRLSLRATDGGSPPKYDDKILTVSVNRNLLAPEFVQQNYEVTIWETRDVDTVVIEVLAHDNDTKAPHNEVTYEIIGNTLAQTYFRIDIKGRIYVRRPLTDDNADTAVYTLSVQAKDKGTPQLTSSNLATVRVTVIRNRSCPTFTPSVLDISIDQSTNSRVIYDANATDSDVANTPFSEIRYSLIGDENAPSFFRVDPQTGQIFTTEPALYSDEATTYQLRVRAEDAVNTVTSCSGNLVLRVTVNRNLNTPQWTNVNTPNNYITTISETHSVTLSVYKIRAVDKDDKIPNNRVSYAMTANSPNRNLFFVDVDGYVYLRNSLVGTSGDPFMVTFIATDGGIPSKTSPEATLTVNVNRNQFPPEILNLPSVRNITENQPVNVEIFRVTGRDNDTVPTYNSFSYELVGDGAATTFFQVSLGGSVTMRQSVATDSSNLFQLRVRAKDGGSPQRQDEELLTICVDKNLANPVMVAQTYSRRILEIQTVSETLVTVQASDVDAFPPNNQLRYFIVGSNTTITNFFMVDEDTGAVMLRRSMLDYPNTATRFTVNFQVSAEDRGSVPRQANNPQVVSITVVRNTAPFFEIEFTYNTQVDMLAPGGSVVFTPLGRDADSDNPFNNLTYSIIGYDAATSVFQINPRTGAISTRPTTNLTQTTGNFVAWVQVTDGGSPPLSDTATVNIKVDRNKESPRFLHALDLTRNIPETLPAGSEVIDLNATDDDFFVPNNVVTYVITGGDGNPLEYFFIHPNTGVIVLQKSVKSITTSTFRLTVQARDQGSPARAASAVVHINVLRDTGVLTFTANNYNETISENRPVGTLVTSTVASPGISIQYSLIGFSSGPDYFSVNSNSGQVTVKQELTQDPSRLTFYRLLVQAVNQGVSTQTATATVNIVVTRNENGPVFTPSNFYTVTVEDTISLGSNITQLTANDLDNDQLNYRILSSAPYTDLFYLNPVTGLITLKGLLQGRSEAQYRFQVQVDDQRIPERTANATVVVNVNKDWFSPQFIRTPYRSQTTENTPDETIIFSTEAVDQDLRERIEYTVIGDNAAPAFFGVISDRGNITIINQALLRKDVGTSYTLRLTAHDTRYPSNRATSTVTISVTRNLNSPRFIGVYSKTILDTVPLGHQVLQVNATDDDNDQIRYSIIGDPRAQTYYYINPETGWITIKQLLTAGSWLSDRIQVQACDLREPQNCAQTFATITIDRNEQSPFFVNLPYQRSLGQSTPASENIVFTVSASDNDLNPNTGSLQYETVGNYPAPSFFSLNSSTGAIKVARGLMEDSLQRSQYNLVVVAYDTQYPTDRATATVTFTVNRNPNPPVFHSNSYTINLPESLPLGSNVTGVQATDIDNDVISYSFSLGGNTGQDDLEFFYLNAETGVITLKSLLTSTTTTRFTFDVTARDPSGKTGSAFVTVNVVRDQPPVFRNTPYRTNVVENLPLGTRVYTVSATDPDLKGQIMYGVTGYLNAPFFFGVDNSSGVVSIINDLRTDIQQQYELIVTAYDSGSPAKTATATLTVSVEKNPSVPQFATPGPFRATIWEDRAPGSNILNISASDQDGNPLRYDLLSDGTAEFIRALMYFTIDPTSGLIYVARSLIDDPARLYKMKVRVRDQQYYEKQTEAAVEIFVNRNVDSPRFLGTYSKTISENMQKSTSILQVSAQDSDMRGSLQYETVGNYPAPSFFSLNSSTGAIKVARGLMEDSLQRSQYNLVVVAYDTQYPTDRATATVTFTVNRNPNPPVFQPNSYTVDLQESLSLGSNVTEVQATDIDNDRLTYEIVNSSPLGGELLFFIDPNTGVLMLRRLLTSTPDNLYRLTIQASDGRGKAANTTATIRITRITSDQRPQFISTPNTTITFRQPVNSSIFTVEAQDSDLVGNLIYELVGIYPAQDFFAVNPITGSVTVHRDLATDSFETVQYTLRLEAYDTNNPKLRAVGLSFITVNRNPATPIFASAGYQYTAEEILLVGSIIMTVNATDSDQDQILYDGVPDQNGRTASEFFLVNRENGMIYLVKDLRTTSQSFFTFKVRARDQGRPENFATANVVISVTRDNGPPTFVQRDYIFELSETEPVNSLIPFASVRAQDNLIRGSLVYEEDGDGLAMAYFALNRSNGEIYVQKSLLTTTETYFELKVTAYDSYYPDNKAKTTVKITVHRQPTFYHTFYVYNILYGIAANTVVGQPKATGDENIIRYSIENFNPSSGVDFFDIDPVSGVISTIRRLGNIKNFVYQLTVDLQYTNLSTRKEKIIVFIIVEDLPCVCVNNSCDLNSHAPIFNAPVYYVNVLEGDYSTKNKSLIEISAEDPDFGPDGAIMYYIQSVSNNGGEKFTIEQDTRESTASMLLVCNGKIENGDNYVIMVRASDTNGHISRRRSSFVPVEVKVVSFKP